MQLKKLIEDRYSVRSFLPKSIEPEKIDYILECARLSPSANNIQPWKFYVITGQEIKQKIEKAYNREWIKNVPLYIIVCKNISTSWKRTNTDSKDFSDIDAAIAAEHICLATADIGLGTCWVCNFDPNILNEVLELPESLEAIAIFPIGYIDIKSSTQPTKNRKPLAEITEWK